MRLSRWKKELSQRTRRELLPRRSKLRYGVLLLVLAVIVGAFVPIYRQYRQSLPEKFLAEGRRLESYGAVTEAQQLYQQLYQQFPESEQAPEALLRSGRIWQDDLGQDQEALLNYLRLELDYPTSAQVLPAREEAARLFKYALRDYSRAIALYQRLLEDYPATGDSYLYEIADCYFRLDNYSQARIEFETLLTSYPHSPLAADALYRKAGLNLLEKRQDEARQDWRQLIESYPDSHYRVQAQFNLAKMLEEQERLEDALNAYQQLTDFPQPSILEEKIDHLKQRIAHKKKAI